MMTVFLYILNIQFSAGQSTLGKLSAAKNGNAGVFNINKALSGLLMFLLFGLKAGLNFNFPTLIYGILYGAFLCISMYTGFKALKTGPIMLTGITVSFSLIIPFIFGIFVWKEKITAFGIAGIIALLISVFLINFVKGKAERVSSEWAFYAFLTLLSNGVCSVIQKYHQLRFPGRYKNEFMIYALLLTAIINISVFALKSEKSKLTFSAEGAASGIMNGLANYMILLLAATEKASVLFPVTSGGNLIAVCLIGSIFFKEHPGKLRFAGICLGIAAIVLLNI